MFSGVRPPAMIRGRGLWSGIRVQSKVWPVPPYWARAVGVEKEGEGGRVGGGDGGEVGGGADVAGFDVGEVELLAVGGGFDFRVAVELKAVGGDFVNGAADLVDGGVDE